ncbi:hypothetical protein A28LD_2293 [Idiomarina sp. A28L]|uniref:DUF484 family protein n=1 Tax=Idiomarina sp. A28L TaxID=1036674 RepID=UPI0002138E19|nr:DUF484 family protein [Idiomarina sp. A28L]EGN74266.1 hypothetical protein A28LD_2293 [Idiomarina sp. A28L]
MKKDNLLAEDIAVAQLDAELVVDYLESNPKFFEQHPRVLQRLNLKHEQHGSVSLIERQQRVLRDKVASLEDEITTLMSRAQHNERLFRQYSEMYQALLQAKSFTAATVALEQGFCERMGLSALKLKFLDNTLPIAEEFQFHADTHKQLLSRRFNENSVYLGRITKEEHKLLFADEANIQSVALVQLGEQGDLGLLVVGSQDPLHFDPAMDFLLLSQLQSLLGFLLPALLKAQGEK